MATREEMMKEEEEYEKMKRDIRAEKGGEEARGQLDRHRRGG